MIVKAIDVNIASKALGGIVEDGKLGAHEETLPVEAQLVVATQLCPLRTVGAIIELCHVAPYVEVGIDAQPEDGRGEGYGGYHLVGNVLHFLIPLRQLHRLLIQREHQLAAVLLDHQHTGIAVESGEACTVAILHPRKVQLDGTATRWTFHALCQRIGSQIEVGHHPTGLQSEPSRTVGQRPGTIHGVVVPLPLQAEFLIGKIVTADNMFLGLAVDQCTDTGGHQAFLVAQHRPSVNPPAGHQHRHTAYAPTVLEDDAVPVAILTIYDGALSHMGESTKGTLQDDALLVRAADIVGTIAHLTTVTAGNAPHLRNHQQVVVTLVLQHPAAFQDSRLVSLALEQLMVRTLDDIRQVGLQLHHLAGAVDDIHAVVVIEEQGAVVEMAHARQEGPLALCLLGSEDIGVAHRSCLVGSQERIETTIVIFQ